MNKKSHICFSGHFLSKCSQECNRAHFLKGLLVLLFTLSHRRWREVLLKPCKHGGFITILVIAESFYCRLRFSLFMALGLIHFKILQFGSRLSLLMFCGELLLLLFCSMIIIKDIIFLLLFGSPKVIHTGESGHSVEGIP